MYVCHIVRTLSVYDCYDFDSAMHFALVRVDCFVCVLCCEVISSFTPFSLRALVPNLNLASEWYLMNEITSQLVRPLKT